jgi:DNA-binding transcriptional LysR family regulator
VRERGSDTWNSMREAFGERFGEVRATMEIASNETIKQAVIAGMGVSFLSSHAIALGRARRQPRRASGRGFPSMRSWFVVHRRTKRLPPVALAFKAFLQAEGARRSSASSRWTRPAETAAAPLRRVRSEPPRRR